MRKHIAVSLVKTLRSVCCLILPGCTWRLSVHLCPQLPSHPPCNGQICSISCHWTFSGAQKQENRCSSQIVHINCQWSVWGAQEGRLCFFPHLENYFFISLSLSLCLLPVFKRFFIIHCHLESSQNKVKCIHPEQTCLTFADSGTIFFQNHSVAVSIFVIILSVFDKNWIWDE